MLHHRRCTVPLLKNSFVDSDVDRYHCAQTRQLCECGEERGRPEEMRGREERKARTREVKEGGGRSARKGEGK